MVDPVGTMISVVIPTLNEIESIGETLAAVRSLGSEVEVIVVDGGSIDNTVEAAAGSGAKVIHAGRGRGSQMKAGAEIAGGDVFWFVHADTVPGEDAAERIRIALRDPHTVAGNFTIRFDGDRWPARFLTWLYPKLRVLGLIYGDSAIFVRKDAYERIGGFRSFPIFEDLDLISRLKREGRIVTLPARVRTSSRRFDGRSFVLTFSRWIFLQLLYWIGVSPEKLGKVYLPLRKKP